MLAPMTVTRHSYIPSSDSWIEDIVSGRPDKPGTVLLYEGGKRGKEGGKKKKEEGGGERGGRKGKRGTFKRCSKNCSLLTSAPMGTNANNGVS